MRCVTWWAMLGWLREEESFKGYKVRHLVLHCVAWSCIGVTWSCIASLDPALRRLVLHWRHLVLHCIAWSCIGVTWSCIGVTWSCIASLDPALASLGPALASLGLALHHLILHCRCLVLHWRHLVLHWRAHHLKSSLGLARSVYNIYTVYDRILGDFNAKNTKYTAYAGIWLWPNLVISFELKCVCMANQGFVFLQGCWVRGRKAPCVAGQMCCRLKVLQAKFEPKVQAKFEPNLSQKCCRPNLIPIPMFSSTAAVLGLLRQAGSALTCCICFNRRLILALLEGVKYKLSYWCWIRW